MEAISLGNRTRTTIASFTKRKLAYKLTYSALAILTFHHPSSPAQLSSKSRMRTSALLTLFFSFFLFIELAFSIPLSTPALFYTSGTRGELFSLVNLIHGANMFHFSLMTSKISSVRRISALWTL
ncbi:hypothetical protein C8R48DRAFT_108198 [Suillus tomentosus]|nr:hypothetical protein C8R48DRAFT_108198 [Suillus tomentosus]